MSAGSITVASYPALPTRSYHGSFRRAAPCYRAPIMISDKGDGHGRASSGFGGQGIAAAPTERATISRSASSTTSPGTRWAGSWTGGETRCDATNARILPSVPSESP